MKILDISREMLSAKVYPGDPAPRLEPLCRIAYGDPCNTSALYACLHNGTHLDAPCHFVPDGADAASLTLEACVGECSVVAFSGVLLGADMERLLPGLQPRILFKGEVEISPSAAFVLADAGVLLVGVEASSVSSAPTTAAVHRQLLDTGMVLLEGLDLSQAEEGTYFLSAPPLKIAEADGSPVRALLFERQRRR